MASERFESTSVCTSRSLEEAGQGSSIDKLSKIHMIKILISIKGAKFLGKLYNPQLLKLDSRSCLFAKP